MIKCFYPPICRLVRMLGRILNSEQKFEIPLWMLFILEKVFTHPFTPIPHNGCEENSASTRQTKYLIPWIQNNKKQQQRTKLLGYAKCRQCFSICTAENKYYFRKKWKVLFFFFSPKTLLITFVNCCLLSLSL